jgi:hypothetical protein
MATLGTLAAGQEKWGKGIDLDAANTKTTDIDEFIRFKLLEYDVLNFRDTDLWEAYKEDFGSFTLTAFKSCNQHLIRYLRLHLRTNGVWVQHQLGTTVPESLFSTTQEEDPIEWTESELRAHLDAFGEFNSVRINNILKRRGITNLPSSSQVVPLTRQGNPLGDLAIVAGRTQEPGRGLENGFVEELLNLQEMYTEEEKYSGENDNFDYKLLIFDDLCTLAGVPQAAKTKAYSTMLRGFAQEHYYTSLVNNGQVLSFHQLCEATRNYFEGPEYEHYMLVQWNLMTLKRVMNKTENSGKTTSECLDLLLNELSHLRLGLHPDLRSEKVFLNKIVTACQGLPACRYACWKPSDTFAGLRNDLLSCIATYEKSNGKQRSGLY